MSSKDATPAASRDRKPTWWRHLAATLIGLVLVIGIAAAAPKAWAVLVIAVPAAWSWYLNQNITPGHGTIIGGTFVGVAALIAYTGTHLSRRSTERIANNSNNLADIQELRRRFVTTTAQFADPSPEIRLAGVYALEALVDDWIDRGRHTDAQTCINYLCGYLTRPYTIPTHDPHLRQTVVTPDAATHIERTYHHPHDDLTVRQAITRTIATHLNPDHHHNWSRYNYDLTGAHFHNADFTGAHFRGITNFIKAQFHGEATSFEWALFYGKKTSFSDAQFHGDRTSFGDAQFYGEQTSFNGAKFHSPTWFGRAEFRSRGTSFGDGGTSFHAAQFYGKWTWFSWAKFHGESTWFGGAEFHSEQTEFNGAEFHSARTSFLNTEFHGELTSFERAEFSSKDFTSFGGAEFHSEQTAFDEAEFHGEATSFDGAEFHGKQTSFLKAQFRSKDLTSFYSAQFHSKKTSFDSPGAWNNVYFDWDTEVPDAVKGTKPDNVRPHDWPPTVVEPTP